eukprot:m.149269 g.149269  ORF g.149269 m.149269 type:complete len:244 (-) comp14204_c0_seq4:1848-2579(-)
MEVYWRNGAEAEVLAEYTVVVPTVSVGHVAQLCADLLVESLEMTLAAVLDHPGMLPLVGYTGKDSELATGLEAYVNREKKLLVLQCRSEVAKAYRDTYTSDLLAWVTKCKFTKCLVLCGADASQRSQSQLDGTQLRFAATEALGEVPSLPETIPQLERITGQDIDPQVLGGDVFIPGGGLARRLYSKANEAGLPLGVLLLFTSQGNNIPQAHMLTEATLAVLDTTLERLKAPPSWRLLMGGAM